MSANATTDKQSSDNDKSRPSGETKKHLTLINNELPPYYVSQFEKTSNGWIWDLLLGFYILAIIAIVVYIELKS